MGIDASKGHEAMDYDEHARTYKGFLTGSKILIVFLVILLGAMAFFLV